MTSGTLDIICGNLENLGKLVMADSYNLTDAGVKKYLKCLKSVTIDRADRLTNRAFVGEFSAPCLEILSVSECRLTDTGLNTEHKNTTQHRT